MAKINVKILVTILMALVTKSIQKKHHFVVQIDTCKYKFDDGKFIDLSSLDRPSVPR